MQVVAVLCQALYQNNMNSRLSYLRQGFVST
jgi:hypothetical protein